MEEIDFRKILYARGSSLDERLIPGHFTKREDRDQSDIINERLSRWKHNLNLFYPDAFEKRLAQIEGTGNNGLASELLSEVNFIGSDDELPAWTKEVFLLGKAVCDDYSNYKNKQSKLTGPPFGHLFRPFINDQVSRILAPNQQMLKKGLGKQLAAEISELLSPALELEFSTFRLSSDSRTEKGSSILYDRFIENLAAGDFLIFLLKYAALSRRAERLINQWKANIISMLTRFEQDEKLLREHFPLNGWDGVLSSVETGMSDRHEGGQTVIKLLLSNEMSIFHKGRSLAYESCYRDLLKSFFAPLKLPYCEVIDCGSYGWSLGVEQKKAKPEVYFKQAGKLVALARLLALTDLHDENLLVTPEGPVLVDCETMLSPIPKQGRKGEELNDVPPLFYTVLRSGLLPTHYAFSEEGSMRICGLEGKRELPKGYAYESWEAVNTDQMAVQTQKTESAVHSIFASENPYLNAKCEDYENELLKGFREAYLFMLDKLDTDGLVDWLRKRLQDKRTRFLLRDTALYDSLEKSSLYPEIATSGLDTSIEYEKLYAAFLTSASDGEIPELKLVAEEANSWKTFDVPLFSINAFERNWLNQSHANPLSVPLFQFSGFEAFQNGFSRMSKDDLHFQQLLIRSSLQKEELPSFKSEKASQYPEASRDELISEAIDIGRYVWNMQAGNHSSPIWLSQQQHPLSGIYQLKPTNLSYFNGLAGIAHFYASLYHISGDRESKQRAERLFRHCLGQLKVDKPLFERENTGLGFGLASLVYGLARSADVLNLSSEKAVLLERFSALRAFHPESENRFGDLLLGSYGTEFLAANLGMENPFNQSISLEASKKDPFAAHGMAGFYHILHKTAPEKAEEFFIQHLLPALDSLWDEKQMSWLNERSGLPHYDWANGSLGILYYLKEPLQSERPAMYEKALAALAKEGALDWHHISNGKAALVDFWCEVGNHSQAFKLASQLLHEKKTEGSYRIPLMLDIGMLSGLCGVGMSFLRLAAPNNMPGILNWNDGLEKL